MPSETFTIIVEAENRTRAIWQQLLDDAGRVAKTFEATANLLMMVPKAMAAVATIKALQDMVKMAVEMGNYGQVVEQTTRKFIAFTGSAAQAEVSLRAIQRATDYGLNAMQSMEATSMLLSMGLADTGEKAAQLARLAVMLGPAWRDAETNIHDFAMLLANQTIRRLDQFGLSVEGVRQRQKELMDLGLARDIAFTNAVLEIGTQKMHELEQAGYRAATGASQLSAALADLRTELAKPFAGPFSAIESDLAKTVRAITDLLAGRDVVLQQGDRGLTRWLLAMATQGEEVMRRMTQATSDTGQAVDNLAQAWDNALTVMWNGLTRVEAAARQLPDTLDRTADEVVNTAGVLRRLPDSLELEMKVYQRYYRQSFPDRQTAEIYGYPPPYNEGQFGFTYTSGPEDELSLTKRHLAQLAAAEKVAAAWERAQMTANSRSAQQWGDVYSQQVSIVQNLLSAGIQASIQLQDWRPGGAGGLTTPGANGPFEDIYRLQAWLRDRSWAEIAAKYGIQEASQGAEIVRKFQLGLWDETVTRLIDVSALQQMVLTQTQAEQFKRAFAERIAAATGVNTNVVSAVIYGDASGNPAQQSQQMTETGQNMAGYLLNGIRRAGPDLFEAGYQAALSYRAGWQKGMTESDANGSQNDAGNAGAYSPPTGSYRRSRARYGME
ncbi:MAG: hypothetical protein N2383_03350 [Caldilineales bacterium]|nr:hypothetical protein [Caldilineales bacterium]